MHEKPQETNMFCILFSFTLLKLPTPFIITKIVTENPDHFISFHLVQLLGKYGLESDVLFSMSVAIEVLCAT